MAWAVKILAILVGLLIREAFVRGLRTRAVGRIVALLTEEPVSAQTVSRLAQALDQAVAQFHAAPLGDAWQYLFLDEVSLRVRRPSGRKRMQLLVAYGVRLDGTRQLLAFTRSQGEVQAAWRGYSRTSIGASWKAATSPRGRSGRWHSHRSPRHDVPSSQGRIIRGIAASCPTVNKPRRPRWRKPDISIWA